MKFYTLILGILGVWRITHLLYAEDGPWDVVIRLRRAAGTGFWGKLLDCFYCTSLWVAAPFAAFLGRGAKEVFLLWLALSAGACLLQRLTETAPADGPALFIEDEIEEKTEAPLRKAEDADPRDRPGP